MHAASARALSCSRYSGVGRQGGPSAPRARRLRALVLAVLLLAFLVVVFSVAPAVAAPTWGIEMTHANAYGARGGVDPYTQSGTTFDRESGFNAYTITVKNTAQQFAEEPVAGESLFCASGSWSGKPTFSYRWLRNGVPISGAEGAEYTVAAADAGAALQCEVTAMIEGGAAMGAAADAVAVSPASSTALPVLEGHPEVTKEGQVGAVGKSVTCTPGTWSAEPTFTYRWLRDGKAIPGKKAEREK